MEELFDDQTECLEFLRRFIDNHAKTAPNKITAGYIQARSNLLDENWVTFKNNHEKIKTAIKRELRAKQAYFIQDTFSLFQEDYLIIKAQLHDLLITLQQKPPQGIPLPPPNQGDVKLPKVNIPEFSGNYQDWTNFHDIFKSLIHDNAKLTNVQKMHYLKTALKGDAEHLLKHFPVTDANYTPSWDMLIARYKNDRLIINSHLKNLVSQPKLLKESAVGLRNLLDTTTECLHALKNLEVPTEHWDAIVVYLIEQRMDSESFKAWEQSRAEPDEVPTFKEISKFLQSRYRTLEIVSEPNEKATSSKSQPRNLQSFHTSTEECSACTGPHRISQCPQFEKISIDSRRHLVETKSLCFNCLGKNHSIISCPSTYKCRFCKKKHHSKLHKNSSTVKTSFSSSGQSAKQTASPPVPPETQTPSTSSQVVLHTLQPSLPCPTLGKQSYCQPHWSRLELHQEAQHFEL